MLYIIGSTHGMSTQLAKAIVCGLSGRISQQNVGCCEAFCFVIRGIAIAVRHLELLLLLLR